MRLHIVSCDTSTAVQLLDLKNVLECVDLVQPSSAAFSVIPYLNDSYEKSRPGRFYMFLSLR